MALGRQGKRNGATPVYPTPPPPPKKEWPVRRRYISMTFLQMHLLLIGSDLMPRRKEVKRRDHTTRKWAVSLISTPFNLSLLNPQKCPVESISHFP